MKKNKLLTDLFSIKNVFYTLGIVVIVGLFGFVLMSLYIGYTVQVECQNAVERYGGECVSALMETVQDESLSFDKRNKAVWAIGQYRGKEALPLLESLYTGEECDHEHALCQYELEKAIKLLEGGTNISAGFFIFGPLKY